MSSLSISSLYLHLQRIVLLKFRGAIKKIIEIIYRSIDFNLYAKSIKPYRLLIKNFSVDSSKGSLLIVSGCGMNVLWAQIWTMLSLAVFAKGYRIFVLTTKKQSYLNRYYHLMEISPVFFEDYKTNLPIALPEKIKKNLMSAKTIESFKNIIYQSAPVGEIALSSYCRNHGSGNIDFSNFDVRNSIKEYVLEIIQSIHIANTIFDKYNVRLSFFTEVFMEEYGAFYYAALEKKINIIRFAGTVRDDAIIVQHLSKSNDRIHHSSLSSSSWAWVKKQPYSEKIESILHKNFMDRYGDRWHRSKRNQLETKILNSDEIRRQLGIPSDQKIAIIYSHILYDTVFFFGTDLFNNYVEWLLETVRVACANPKINWLIKVHPSNMWRGELNSLLKGRYEEELVIEKSIGKLPSHVRIIPANTKINPYSWFELADYGITVRGTSGLEMAALGKTVITAGTGRYEGNGFTIDPTTKKSYLELLSQLPNIDPLTSKQVKLAKRYAYSIFNLKPYTLISLFPLLKTGKKNVLASDDINYIPAKLRKNELPQDLQVFSDWVEKSDSQDLLNKWESN